MEALTTAGIILGTWVGLTIIEIIARNWLRSRKNRREAA
jgi:hypothetical protein